MDICSGVHSAEQSGAGDAFDGTLHAPYPGIYSTARTDMAQKFENIDSTPEISLNTGAIISRRTGKGRYTCNICNASFKHSSSQKTHEITHIVDKGYPCDRCDLSFTYKGNLKKHKLIHTGEKPYKCDVCGADFTQSSAMKTHSRIHTGEKPYNCNRCDKHFRNKGNLIKHERVHTGEKPFICDDCNKAFTQSSTLKIHQRLHTGEKPYSCNSCDASFTNKGNLKNHQRKNSCEKDFIMEIENSALTQNEVFKKGENIHQRDCYYPLNLCESVSPVMRESDCSTPHNAGEATSCSTTGYASAFTPADSSKNKGDTEAETR